MFSCKWTLSSPKFMLLFHYPDLRDIEVNDSLLKILLRCNFSSRVMINPSSLHFLCARGIIGLAEDLSLS